MAWPWQKPVRPPVRPSRVVVQTIAFRQNEQVNEPSCRTITRRSDEPKLKIGDIVPINEGVVGIVLARFVRSDEPGEVHYIVELRPGEAARGAN